MARRLNVLILLSALSLTSGCGHGTDSDSNQATTIELPHPSNVDCSYSFNKAGLCASLKWTKTPTLDEDGAFKITFTKNINNTPVEPGYALVAIKRMPEMACPPVTLHLSASKNPDGSVLSGTFEAPVSLEGMPGKSEIWIRLKNGNTVVDEAKVNYTF